MWIPALLLAVHCAGADPAAPLQRFEQSQPHMGVMFHIVLFAPDERAALPAFGAAFERIRELNKRLSDYDPESELNRLCQLAPTTKPQPASEDLYEVLRRSEAWSRQTEGRFDATIGPLSKLWRQIRKTKTLPDPQVLTAARQAVGYRHVRLHAEPRSIELLQADMQLDLGGIAKGYAADAALAVLRERGLTHALVDGSGDLAVGDPPPGKEGWRIGVAPLQPNDPPSRYLSVKNCGVATSGDAWQYVEIDGVRYSHILDPQTGKGLTTHSSVTVVAPNGADADALASIVSVYGPVDGIAFATQQKDTAAMVVYLEQGKVRTAATPDFGDWETRANR
ncbi:FAD:protein FMN transferase [Lignipirellula cremea]|uniref:FAD:protein FMN transferase n=1 Tax=Lignipirellula cremea TaxID=2528010 RepID=A0A518E071_9BACT|nr:FAD:protein FMN transferase [Lignipirellula cremea]QDU97482.1 Thiamine biosynthesis lipoprotein ApbE precursor [Lignipirellula cremea]